MAISGVAVAPSYAGDIDSRHAWQFLADDPEATLIDVRTRPEWAYVGIPDLRPLGKNPLFVEWLIYPDMVVNPAFTKVLSQRQIGFDVPLLFICRSGQRSRDAAVAATTAGYRRCYNLADGFEGPLNGDRQRGQSAGWKVAALPWIQS